MHSVWIINKSGGLVFRDVYADIAPIDTNETLRLASMWHSMHAIAAQLGPELRGELPSEVGIDPEHGGIECLGAFYTLVPVRPRWRGERRSLRTLPGVLSAHPSLSIPVLDAFQLQLTPLNSTPTSLRMERPSETDGFHLHCAQTPTGTKLMLTCAPGTFADHDAGQAVLRTVRDLYADYV